MLMHNPPHPGEIVKSVLIDNSGISVTQAAKSLGITRGSLSKLINCRSGISPEMAVRLSIALNTSSQMWLNLQSQFDLWEAEHKRKKLLKQVTKIKALIKKKSVFYKKHHILHPKSGKKAVNQN